MSLDTRVHKLLPPGRKNYKDGPYYGIELEYENFRSLSPIPHWSQVVDHSLRRGIELVSDPIPADKIDERIDIVEKAVAKTKLEATKRCGIHVHINCQHMRLGNLLSLLCLYNLVEPTIFQTYAKGRDDSNFCAPLYYNRGTVFNIRRDMRSCRNGHPTFTNMSNMRKYGAINLGPLPHFGTVEMRQPYCTRDFDAIRNWVKFCHLLQETAMKYNDPLLFLNQYKTKSLMALQREFFGTIAPVNHKIQARAKAHAVLCAGHIPKNWKELNWSIS